LIALAGKKDILNLFLSQKEFKKENYIDKIDKFLENIKLNLFLSQKEFKKENYIDKIDRFLENIKTV